MVDVLGRGWSPTKRQYRLLRLGLALLLVASPALVYLSGYGRPSYRYDAVQVEATDSGIAFESDVRFHDGFEGVDCYREIERSRLCLLERQLVDGNLTFDGPTAYTPTADELYTYHDGQFYARIDDATEDGVVLGLRPVDAAAVLGTVATDYENLRDPLQRAVKGDIGTTHRDLDADGRIVWYDGNHYAIYEVDSTEANGYVPAFLAALVGLGLLFLTVRVGFIE